MWDVGKLALGCETGCPAVVDVAVDRNTWKLSSRGTGQSRGVEAALRTPSPRPKQRVPKAHTRCAQALHHHQISSPRRTPTGTRAVG